MTEEEYGKTRVLLFRYIHDEFVIVNKYRTFGIFIAEVTGFVYAVYGFAVTDMVMGIDCETVLGEEFREALITLDMFRHTVGDVENRFRVFRNPLCRVDFAVTDRRCVGEICFCYCHVFISV